MHPLIIIIVLLIVQFSQQAIFVGKPAPYFKKKAVVGGQFQDLSLNDFHGKYLVLFFYPLDFTFVCPTELISFSDRIDEFKQLDTNVVAVSVDSEYSHMAWINQSRDKGGLGQMNIPLVSDINKSMTREYGVLIEEEGVALRGLFIIDPNGIVKQVTINDLAVGRSVDETIRLVTAFKEHDKHGSLCPANWKKGDKAIDSSDPLKFFKKEEL
jgi:alkyl hydroperoxide reductase subunit AhpC